MGLLDTLFGRSKPVKSRTEQLFAISTARITLEDRLGMKVGHTGGVVYRPIQSSSFEETQRELTDLLTLSERESGSTITQQHDAYGYSWVMVNDQDFEDLVATIHMVSLTLAEKGFQDQLLAAAFRFDKDGRPVYWLYNYKRGAYYPFAPTGPNTRDNGAELRYAPLMERELPMEKQTEQWYPLWGIPF